MQQFTARSALLTLDGWNLVFHCPACGPHEKPGRTLLAKTRLTVEIGKVLPRLRCPTCGAAPAKLQAVCMWIQRFGRDPIVEDLTDIVQNSGNHDGTNPDIGPQRRNQRAA